MRRRPTAKVEPVRVWSFDPDLGVNVRRTVGHRWRCDCGERGRSEETPALARAAGGRHVFDQHV